MSGIVSSINHVFVDIDVLIYANVSSSPYHQVALDKIRLFHEAGIELWLSRQIIHEYMTFMTRPGLFKQKVPLSKIVERILFFENQFRVAEDGLNVTKKLQELVSRKTKNNCHLMTSYIVATMQATGIHHLLTNNVAEYKCYNDIISILPLLEN